MATGSDKSKGLNLVLTLLLISGISSYEHQYFNSTKVFTAGIMTCS